MKKLAFIKKDFHSAGGLEKVTSQLINALLKKGVEVTLFTTSSPSFHQRSSFNRDPKLCIYQPQGLFKAQKLRDFNRWLSEKISLTSFDAVFSMDRSSVQTHHRAGNGVHAAYLDLRIQLEGLFKKWSFAINPLHRVQLQLEEQTFESPLTRSIIVNSHMVQKQILDYYNTPVEKIHVIHNGVEWNELETDFNDSLTHRKEHALRLGLDPSVFQFLFVGHNFERKGLGILLRALSLVSNKNFHLSVVGSDKQMASYQALAARLGLRSRVTFFGAQTLSKPFYLAADSLVVPSIYDPFANVTVEALALGLFVVSSKMNGGHEVLQPHTGVIVNDLQNKEEWVAALDKALNLPKEISQATSIRSSVAHLDVQSQLEKICNLCIG